MIEVAPKTSDWTSYCQLIQQLAAGTVRRNTFTQWELDLLLDFQLVRLRKSARPDVLRRYLRAIQRQMATNATEPMRFSSFFETEVRPGTAAHPPVPEVVLPRAS